MLLTTAVNTRLAEREQAHEQLRISQAKSQLQRYLRAGGVSVELSQRVSALVSIFPQTVSAVGVLAVYLLY